MHRAAHQTCAPDKCGGFARTFEAAPMADSASGGFIRQIPILPVTPAVGQFLARHKC
jgi:hypothetical protein